MTDSVRSSARSFIYVAGEGLSLAEATAACLDGHLAASDEVYVPADLYETAAVRAASVAHLLRGVLAATHLTAAWIHGALPTPPLRHTVQRAVPYRLHAVIHRRLHYRDVEVPPRDLRRIAEQMVTTPERTLADLIRIDDDEHQTAALAMADRDRGLPLRARIWLIAAGAVPFKRVGVARLRRLERRAPPSPAQDDVTRYTS
ncbi:hypothetical protein GCM10009808_08050 [Microbacterium sediminicola]|uniref:AbiEi antitoxin C-terminal domain-containing protein n=1 Tax=Microbacterium sediminicola TaxID=415210 RepID=A0ABN2HTL3_9MICO